jgi:hypothetical protein
MPAAELPIITYFIILASLLKNNGAIWATLYACRISISRFDAQLAFLHSAVVRRRNRAKGAAQDASVATNAAVFVYGYHAVCYGQCAGYAAFYAQRLVAVPARNGKTDAVFFFNFYSGIYFNVFERPCHVFFICPGKGTEIFAQMATEAPLFIYINSLHTSFSCVFNAQNTQFFFI